MFKIDVNHKKRTNLNKEIFPLGLVYHWQIWKIYLAQGTHMSPLWDFKIFFIQSFLKAFRPCGAGFLHFTINIYISARIPYIRVVYTINANNFVIWAKFCCHSVPRPGIGNLPGARWIRQAGRSRGMAVQEIVIACNSGLLDRISGFI